MFIVCDKCLSDQVGPNGQKHSSSTTLQEWYNHLQSPEHQANFIKEPADNWPTDLNERTVIVSGFKRRSSATPIDVQELLEYFSEYSFISDFHYNENSYCDYILVQFDELTYIKQLLKDEHQIMTIPVHVTQKTGDVSANNLRTVDAEFEFEEPSNESNTRISNWDSIVSKRQTCDKSKAEIRQEETHAGLIDRGIDLDEQLAKFVQLLTLTNKELMDRSDVIIELERTLNANHPLCTIHPFGSFVTGLGDKESDIDIYVNLYGKYGESISKYIWDATNINTREMAFEETGELLRLEKRIYRRILPIPRARVPIIRVTHVSGLYCDLSFENVLAVQNSKLIAFYQTLDHRVKYLMILVRYWASFHGLSGSVQIKNYALILMVLVYLTRSQIIPSINVLQAVPTEYKAKKNIKMTDNDEITMMVDGWNAGFNNKYGLGKDGIVNEQHKVPADGVGVLIELNERTGLPNARPLLNTFQGFLEMFGDFDYENYMICTLTGEFIRRDRFAPGLECDLPQSLALYKQYVSMRAAKHKTLDIDSPLCLQDPFKLNCNVGGCAKQFIINDFKRCCKFTVERIHSVLADPNPYLLDVFVGIRTIMSKNEAKLAGKFIRAMRMEKGYEPRKTSYWNRRRRRY